MGAIQQALSGAANAAIGVASTLKAKEMVDEQKKLNEENQLSTAMLTKAALSEELPGLEEDISKQKKSIELREKGQTYVGDSPEGKPMGESILWDTEELKNKDIIMLQRSLNSLEEKKSAKQLQLDIVNKRIEKIIGGKR